MSLSDWTVQSSSLVLQYPPSISHSARSSWIGEILVASGFREPRWAAFFTLGSDRATTSNVVAPPPAVALLPCVTFHTGSEFASHCAGRIASLLRCSTSSACAATAEFEIAVAVDNPTLRESTATALRGPLLAPEEASNLVTKQNTRVPACAQSIWQPRVDDYDNTARLSRQSEMPIFTVEYAEMKYSSSVY